MKIFSPTVLFAIIYFLNSNSVIGQPTLIGPSCVLSGVEYQYNIQGNIPSGSQLCVTGGKISGDSTCVSNLSPAFVRITWTGNQGSIAFTSPEGNISLQVSMTVPLQAGTIDSTIREQYINYNTSPSSIACAMPAGGGCGASYSYQWQRSSDNMNWEIIAGAASQNLNSLSALTETSFYRRKTTETVSGSTIYSNIAVVYVAANTNGQ